MTKKRVRVLDPAYGVAGMFKTYGDKFIVGEADGEADLIVFTGGSDVSPSLYGERELPCSAVHAQRDLREKATFEKYKKTPKVGICRGGQFLNVMSGGAMFQDVNGHRGIHEMINLLHVPGIDEDKIQVTSTHHQMMIPGRDGHVLAIAMNDAGTKGLSDRYLSARPREVPKFDTEVVWYPKTNSLCFQPHPEFADNKMLQPMVNYFFKLLDHFFFETNPEC